MPIPRPEEMVVKAEIKTAIFQLAFIELASEMAQRDRNAYATALGRLGPILEAFSTNGFRPPALDTFSLDDIRRIQKEGLQEALAEFGLAARRLRRRTTK